MYSVDCNWRVSGRPLCEGGLVYKRIRYEVCDQVGFRPVLRYKWRFNDVKQMKKIYFCIVLTCIYLHIVALINRLWKRVSNPNAYSGGTSVVTKFRRYLSHTILKRWVSSLWH